MLKIYRNLRDLLNFTAVKTMRISYIIFCMYFTFYPFYMWTGIAQSVYTRYDLERTGIESQWGGQDFPHQSRAAEGSTHPSVQWVSGLSRGKTAGAWS